MHLIYLISSNALLCTNQATRAPRSKPCLFFLSRQNVPEDRRENNDDDGEEEKEEEDDSCSDEGFMGMTPLLQAHHAMEKVEEFVHKVMSSHSHSFIGVITPAESIKPGE